METMDFAKAPPQGLQGEKGAPRHGSPCAPSWTKSGPSKATSGRRHCGGNTFTAALSVPLLASCCRAAGQRRGQRSAAAERRWGCCPETWKTTGPGAPSREPLAASQKPQAGAHGHRFSQGQAAGAHQGRIVPCSQVTPSPRLAAGTCPRARRGPSEQASEPAPALAQARVQRPAPERAPLPSLPFQRESCELVGTEKAAGRSAPAASPGSTCKPPVRALAPGAQASRCAP